MTFHTIKDEIRILPLSIISLVIAGILGISSGSGLLFQNIYTPYVHGQLVPMLLGQDLLSFICVPILLFAIILTFRKSFIGPIIWVGILIYITYAYALLAFGAVYSNYFLFYIALMGLSLYSIFFIVQSIDFVVYREILDFGIFTKIRGIYLIIVGVSISIVWIIILLRTIIYQIPIIGINTVYVIDLTILLPAFVFTGLQQLRHITWSYYLASVFMVKAVTLGLSILLEDLYSIQSGWQINIGLCIIFGVFTFIGAIIFLMDVNNGRKYCKT
jgi:hypothetical protein